MTKTYEFVTLYYKGHSPLKKEDNSFFMCIYTMLLILFTLSAVLVFSSFYGRSQFEDKRKFDTETKITEYEVRLSTTTKQPVSTTSTTTQHTTETSSILGGFLSFFVGDEDSEPDSELIDTSYHPVFIDEMSTDEPIEVMKPGKLNANNNNELLGHIKMPSQPDGEFLSIKNLTSDYNNETEIFKSCDSTKCQLAASEMISLINLSIEPCRNFYGFACENMHNRERTDLDIFEENSQSKNSNHLKILDDFYKSCAEYEDFFDYDQRLNKIKILLNEHFSKFTHRNDFPNITDIVSNLVLLNAMPLINIDIDIHRSTFKFILTISPPNPKSQEQDIWHPFSNMRKKCLRKSEEKGDNPQLIYNYYQSCMRNYSDYLTSVETAVKQLGDFGNLTKTEIFHQIKLTKRILVKVFSIYNHILPNQNVLGQKCDYVTIVELQQQFPAIHWLEFFNTIGNKEYNIIKLCDRENLKKIFKIFEIPPKHLVHAFTAILSDLSYQNTILPTHRSAREKYCRKLTKALMPDIMNYLYKKTKLKNTLNEQRVYIKNIFNKFKRQFIEKTQNLEWLNQDSKNSVIQKLKKTQLAIFTTDNEHQEYVLAEEKYSKLNLDNVYISNFFKLLKFKRKSLFSLHGTDATTDAIFRYFVDNSRDEPVFFHSYDTVCIPYGLVAKVSTDLPKYLNIARIGFPLARIIGQLFDPLGMEVINLDQNASLTYEYFVNETKISPKIINFKNVAINFTTDLSVAERIADNTALRILTDSIDDIENNALLPWISYKFCREKIFFIAIAQELCQKTSLADFVIQVNENSILPPPFRLEDMINNSATFAYNFNCPSLPVRNGLQFPHLIKSQDDIL